jgi:hypothetical protein
MRRIERLQARAPKKRETTVIGFMGHDGKMSRCLPQYVLTLLGETDWDFKIIEPTEPLPPPPPIPPQFLDEYRPPADSASPSQKTGGDER